MFASSIPEIIELVGSGSKYSGELKREHGKRYPNKSKSILYYYIRIICIILEQLQLQLKEKYKKKKK